MTNPTAYNRSIDSAYSLRNVPKAHALNDVSLYTAAKALGKLGEDAPEGAYIERSGRVVAFWSAYHGSVRATDYAGDRAGKGAHADERELVNGWAF